MKLNADEFKVVLKLAKWKKGLWDSYINVIDPRKQLDIKTKELMRSAFLSGCMYTLCSFYEGQGEDEKSADEIWENHINDIKEEKDEVLQYAKAIGKDNENNN